MDNSCLIEDQNQTDQSKKKNNKKAKKKKSCLQCLCPCFYSKPKNSKNNKKKTPRQSQQSSGKKASYASSKKNNNLNSTNNSNINYDYDDDDDSDEEQDQLLLNNQSGSISSIINQKQSYDKKNKSNRIKNRITARESIAQIQNQQRNTTHLSAISDTNDIKNKQSEHFQDENDDIEYQDNNNRNTEYSEKNQSQKSSFKVDPENQNNQNNQNLSNSLYRQKNNNYEYLNQYIKNELILLNLNEFDQNIIVAKITEKYLKYSGNTPSSLTQTTSPEKTARTSILNHQAQHQNQIQPHPQYDYMLQEKPYKINYNSADEDNYSSESDENENEEEEENENEDDEDDEEEVYTIIHKDSIEEKNDVYKNEYYRQVNDKKNKKKYKRVISSSGKKKNSKDKSFAKGRQRSLSHCESSLNDKKSEYQPDSIKNKYKQNKSKTKFEPFYLFSQYNLCKIQQDQHDTVTPEIISMYIAKRAQKYSLIIDAFCGIGGNTIQFAKQSDLVIANDISQKCMEYSKYNCGIYSMVQNVEFLCSDYFNLHKLKADLTFLSPSYTSIYEDNGRLDLFQGFSPQLLPTLLLAYKQSKNIMLFLPKQADISQIPHLFTQLFNQLKNPSTITVEIEQILVNGSLEHFIIHFGPVNNVSQQKEIDFFQQQLLLTQITGIGIENGISRLLYKLKDQIGLHNIQKHYLSALQNPQKYDILLDFVDILLEKDIVSANTIGLCLNTTTLSQSNLVAQSNDDNHYLLSKKSMDLANMANLMEKRNNNDTSDIHSEEGDQQQQKDYKNNFENSVNRSNSLMNSHFNKSMVLGGQSSSKVTPKKTSNFQKYASNNNSNNNLNVHDNTNKLKNSDNLNNSKRKQDINSNSSKGGLFQNNNNVQQQQQQQSNKKGNMKNTDQIYYNQNKTKQQQKVQFQEYSIHRDRIDVNQASSTQRMDDIVISNSWDDTGMGNSYEFDDIDDNTPANFQMQVQDDPSNANNGSSYMPNTPWDEDQMEHFQNSNDY